MIGVCNVKLFVFGMYYYIIWYIGDLFEVEIQIFLFGVVFVVFFVVFIGFIWVWFFEIVEFNVVKEFIIGIKTICFCCCDIYVERCVV